MTKRFGSSMGPTLDADGRLGGERYEELQDRADEQRQIAAVHDAAAERQAATTRRMEDGELTHVEWLWEVQKRDNAIRNWAEKWNEQQASINRLARERHDNKVKLMELKLELGQMASAEERNGNYKTADVLRMVTLRLKDAVTAMEQDKTEQDKKE